MSSINEDILKQSIVTLPAGSIWTTSGSNGTTSSVGAYGGQIQNVWVDEYVDPIRGEMIVVSHSISGLEASVDITPVNDFKNKIKTILLEKLIEELKKSNSIEFTSVNDPRNNQTIFKARIFATPDNQVRILRKAGK